MESVFVRYRSGSDCHADAVPAGWLGTANYVEKANGRICDAHGWRYNASSTSSYRDEIDPSCNFDYARLVTRSKVYRPNYGGYYTSGLLASPYAKWSMS